MVDEILLNETQKLSTTKEAPEVLDPDCAENDLYQVDKMSLEETKEKHELHKRAFECELKNSYGIENWDELIHIHDK